MAAWEAADPEAFREVLRADAAIEPVGSRTWFAGREKLPGLRRTVHGRPRRLADDPRTANDQPAAAAWFRGEPFGLAVLTTTAKGITAVSLFPDPTLAT